VDPGPGAVRRACAATSVLIASLNVSRTEEAELAPLGVSRVSSDSTDGWKRNIVISRI
jgi:hypothetical protein